jgi:hypothetical protein
MPYGLSAKISKIYGGRKRYKCRVTIFEGLMHDINLLDTDFVMYSDMDNRPALEHIATTSVNEHSHIKGEDDYSDISLDYALVPGGDAIRTVSMSNKAASTAGVHIVTAQHITDFVAEQFKSHEALAAHLMMGQERSSLHVYSITDALLDIIDKAGLDVRRRSRDQFLPPEYIS